MRRKEVLVASAIVGAVVLLLAIVKYVQISSAIAGQAAMRPPPEAVTSALVEAQAWPRKLEAVGSVSAVHGVVLSAETAGNVTKFNFESGAEVPAGAVIVELDSAVETANLRAAQVMRDREDLAYKRAKELISVKATSEATLESAEAVSRAADAEVKAIQAQIDKKRIIAPFSGRLGIQRINLGEYVNVGQAVIPLFDLKNLYVDFSIPQRDVAKLSTGLKIEVHEESMAERTLSGEVATIDPQIDSLTRNVKVRAVVANPEEILKPGMFVRVTVLQHQNDPLLVIPTTGVLYAPYGDSVYVIEKGKDPSNSENLSVRQQFVKLGEQRGNLVAVLDGLKGGEEVVSSGTFKLRPGAAVTVQNALAPSTQTNPNLPDT